MRLSSVREAKGEFVADFASRGVITKSVFGSRVADRGAVAAGISRRRGNDFALALRVRSATPDVQRILDMWRQRLGPDLDERRIGTVRKQSAPWYQRRTRPIVPGVSVSHEKVTAGTVGAFVHRDGGAGAVELLSNNHVLADENRGLPGDRVVQPGRIDGGGVPHDVIGSLSEFVPLTASGPNLVDCAVASLDDEHGWSLETFKLYGGLAGIFDIDESPDEDFPTVAKFGRTSGHTMGTITAIELDSVVVEYDIGPLSFDGQMEIEGLANGSFSEPGDSGSLVVTADASGARAVGLLFAGSDTGGANGAGLTYVNPIQSVLDALGAELLLEEGSS